MNRQAYGLAGNGNGTKEVLRVVFYQQKPLTKSRPIIRRRLQKEVRLFLQYTTGRLNSTIESVCDRISITHRFFNF